jgi:hypothetical protein
MKDFPHASFPPDVISIMTTALDSALSTLPHPVSSAHVKAIGQSILRSTKEGERDPEVPRQNGDAGAYDLTAGLIESFGDAAPL